MATYDTKEVLRSVEVLMAAETATDGVPKLVEANLRVAAMRLHKTWATQARTP